MAITDATVSPMLRTLRTPQLSNARAELLDAFTFDPQTQNASEFFARFTSMGLKDRLMDCVSSYFHSGGRKKELLEAIAIHKIAAAPGGEAELIRMGKFQELGPSAKYLLSEMTPDTRKEMLAKPPVLSADGYPQMTFALPGSHRQATIDLVLTRECFEDGGPVGSTLTRDEILASGWRQQDPDGNKLFLNGLVKIAPKLHDLSPKPIIGLIMHWVTGAREDGDTKECTAQDQTVCKELRRYGLAPRTSNRVGATSLEELNQQMKEHREDLLARTQARPTLLTARPALAALAALTAMGRREAAPPVREALREEASPVREALREATSPAREARRRQ